MVVIRLSRRGRKKVPHFAIVVADQRQKNTGRFIEKIGFINKANQADKALSKERYEHWVSQGAQPSHTVQALFKSMYAEAPKPVAKKAEAKKPVAKKAETKKPVAKKAETKKDEPKKATKAKPKVKKETTDKA